MLRPLAASVAMLATTIFVGAATPTEFFVYFGTYTNAKTASKGIYRARFDATTGKLSPAELAAEAKDPAWLALHPTGKFLYAIDESADAKRTPGQGLGAYALDANTGALTLLNRQSTGSSGACHITVDATGRTVLVANYGGGGVSAVILQPDGRLGVIGSVIQHTGSSVNPSRQKGPHAHQIITSADNRFAFVPDLGLSCPDLRPQLRDRPAHRAHPRFGLAPARLGSAPPRLSSEQPIRLRHQRNALHVDRVPL